MKREGILKIVMGGLFMALVFVLTTYTRIPIPSGYIHLGDCAIFIAASLFGWKYGAVVGGVGSALSDFIGYPQYTIPTFIIKGIMGIIVGKIAGESPAPVNFRSILGMVLGGLWMVFGYYITDSIIGHNFIAPLVPTALLNILQFVCGIVISVILLVPLNRVKHMFKM